MTIAAASVGSSFAALLKEWRRLAGVSQLELAMRCGSSQKHVSFLESGRSNPSRVMIFALGEAMDIPLRHRNELLLAAGFAPSYRESSLDDPELAAVKTAIDKILAGNEPYPAFVFDRLHNTMAANLAAIKLQLFLFDVEAPEQLPEFAGNVVRGLLHPDGYRKHVRNWDHVASVMLRRLRAESHAAGNPKEAVALLDEVASYDGAPTDWMQRTDMEWRRPMLTVDFEKDGRAFSLLSTIASLGAPFDVTLQEIRIESFYPADDGAVAFFTT